MTARNRGALPTLLVVGAMKCATSALHAFLDAHPQVAMSPLKELNFFNGPERAPHPREDRWWVEGQWHRGVGWYSRQFDPSADARGEASPAYTSPSYPWTAERIAAVLPEARLLYLVRDPVDRAVSQYAHHHRDRTEPRGPAEALLDPGSQYVARSRYVDRLQPYLRHFRREQVHVVVQERLLRDPRSAMAGVYAHVGVDPDWQGDVLQRRVNAGERPDDLPDDVRRRFRNLVADDTERLTRLVDDDLEEWSDRE